jgi:hypothetical protein
MEIKIKITGRKTEIDIDGKITHVKTAWLKKMYLNDIILYYNKNGN